MVFDLDYPQFENLETGELLPWHEVFDNLICGRSCYQCGFDALSNEDFGGNLPCSWRGFLANPEGHIQVLEQMGARFVGVLDSVEDPDAGPEISGADLHALLEGVI